MADTSLPLAGAIAGDTFRNLVRQFSQELCFYRELIQNALDAGTRRVDVRVEYLDDKGMVRAQVADQGEGMDRTIIDTQLTRLFSSSKEDDFTKIGKFGIGFVSVFAIGPEAVVVDTGRNGEDWRVIFQPSGEFERVKLRTAVEGTTIQVFKKMPKADFPGFVAGSRATISYWCRHSEVEIDFNGERINEAFDLQSPIKIELKEPGTEVVVALVPPEKRFYGFYNGGITLLEGDAALLGAGQLLEAYRADLPGIAFKIKSRYLEHTLTRDNVKQDANFDKAMKIVRRILTREIPAAILTQLTAVVNRPRSVYNELLEAALPFMDRIWTGAGKDAKMIPCLPPHAPVSLNELTRARVGIEKLLKGLGQEAFVPMDAEPGPVTEALAVAGIPVVAAAPEDPLVKLLARHVRLGQASRILAVTEPAQPSDQLSGVTSQAVKLLERCGIRFSTVTWARFSAAETPFLVTSHAGHLVLAQPAPALKEDEKPPLLPQLASDKGRLVINVGHPLITRLAAAWEVDAALAAYLFAKMLCLCDGLHPQMDSRLLQYSLEERARV